MSQYHDFNYVKHILNLSVEEGLNLYNSCIDRFNDNRMWQLYLVEILRGYEGNFEDYKKQQTSQHQINIMTRNQKEKEEKRIFSKVEKIIELDKSRRKKDARN